MPKLYVIAGPNGAGKTTFIKRTVPEEFRLPDFLNADEIARGLSPFDPTRAQFEAGRLVLGRFEQFVAEGRDFCLETTLSGKTYRRHFESARAAGYFIRLDFLLLPRVEISRRRVAHRVAHGGHDVLEEHLVRRFKLGVQNLFHHYRPTLDEWRVFRNDLTPPLLIAAGDATEMHVVNAAEFAKVVQVFELKP